MIDAARSFDSVTFRERFRVTDLVIEDDAVLGIRGEDASGVHEFRATLTIGADGMRSSVAQIASERIDAFKRVDVPCARAYYYAYFEGVSRKNLGDELVAEFESAPGAGNLVCRCENGLTVAATAFDASEMQTFRTDLASNLRSYLIARSRSGRYSKARRSRAKCFLRASSTTPIAIRSPTARSSDRRCGPARRSAVRPGAFDGADERVDCRRARARVVLRRPRQRDSGRHADGLYAAARCAS